jgi:hypothetical protein
MNRRISSQGHFSKQMTSKGMNSDGKLPDIYPDKSYAQIIFATDNREKTLERALDIAKDLTAEVIEVKKLTAGRNEETVVLKVTDRDMETLILGLAEAGFNDIKGYNSTGGK